MTLGVPSAVSRMLAGLRSRWTIPSPCAVGDGAGERLDQPGRRRGRPRGAVERLIEAAAVEILEREERPAGRLADLVDLDDVGVLRAGRPPRPRRGTGAASPVQRAGRPGSS